jgi:protein-S-isoprenylcysteine O-methyltransferase Ste14
MSHALVRVAAVVLFTALIGAVIFGCAGRLDLPWVWALLAAQTVLASLFAVVVPRDLVRERLKPGSEGRVHDHHRALAVPLMVASWVIVGLDTGRFHWSDTIPAWLRAGGLAVFVAGMLLTLLAVRTNRFYSSVIRLQRDRGHEPVTAGPYRVVRHPGYTGTMLGMLGGGLTFGSWLAMAPTIGIALLFVRRTINEDRMLRRELDGYEAYARRVRSRLVPGVW